MSTAARLRKEGKVTKETTGSYRVDYSHDSHDEDYDLEWSEEEGAMVPKSDKSKGSSDESTRVTPDGLKQTGKKLGLADINGLFASLHSDNKITKGDLPSANGYFSAALRTTPQGDYQGGDLEISTKDTGYEVGAPVTKGTKIEGSGVSYQEAPEYEVPETSVPMTTGRMVMICRKVSQLSLTLQKMYELFVCTAISVTSLKVFQLMSHLAASVRLKATV